MVVEQYYNPLDVMLVDVIVEFRWFKGIIDKYDENIFNKLLNYFVDQLFEQNASYLCLP